MSGCSYQLHLADCRQKNACSAHTLSSLPETITVFLNLVTHTELNLSFFLFNQDPFASPLHGAKIVLSKQWFWFNFQKVIYQQSNLTAASWVKEGRSAELISVIIPSEACLVLYISTYIFSLDNICTQGNLGYFLYF